MKKADIYEVAVKILGFYLIVPFIVAVHEFIASLSIFGMINLKSFSHILYSCLHISGKIIIILIYLFFAFLFIAKTKYVTKKICSPSNFEESATIFTDKKSAYEVALKIGGFLFIVWTVIDFLIKFIYYSLTSRMYAYDNYEDQNYLNILLVKIILGTFVIMVSSRIASFLAKEKKKDEE